MSCEHGFPIKPYPDCLICRYVPVPAPVPTPAPAPAPTPNQCTGCGKTLNAFMKSPKTCECVEKFCSVCYGHYVAHKRHCDVNLHSSKAPSHIY